MRILLCWTSHYKEYGSVTVSNIRVALCDPRANQQPSASLSWDVVQEQIPAVDFVQKYAGLFSFKSVHFT